MGALLIRMSEELQTVWSGTFTIFGIVLHCHILSDGRRVIEAHDLEDLFKAMGEEQVVDIQELGKELRLFQAWRTGGT
jgi:hypothetical protein